MRNEQITILRDLPGYSAGTILTHDWEEQPNKYHPDEIYRFEHRYYQSNSFGKLMCPDWLVSLIQYAYGNVNLEGWFENE